jgi:acetolactate decarboxylase
MLVPFLVSCTNKIQNEIKVYGALSKIMHEGARDGVVALSDVITEDHVYGLGAMENLDGEILIMDSNLLINRAKVGEKPTHQTEATFETKALLLVTTQIKSWKNVTMKSNASYNSIDAEIKREAGIAGINIDKPFPFIIEGNFNKLAWHIISPQDKDGSHDDHLAKSWKRDDSNISGKVMGFYSENHQAIFTHHTRFTHLHIWFESEGISGHVDDLVITEPWTIYFPEN